MTIHDTNDWFVCITIYMLSCVELTQTLRGGGGFGCCWSIVNLICEVGVEVFAALKVVGAEALAVLLEYC